MERDQAGNSPVLLLQLEWNYIVQKLLPHESWRKLSVFLCVTVMIFENSTVVFKISCWFVVLSALAEYLLPSEVILQLKWQISLFCTVCFVRPATSLHSITIICCPVLQSPGPHLWSPCREQRMRNSTVSVLVFPLVIKATSSSHKLLLMTAGWRLT